MNFIRRKFLLFSAGIVLLSFFGTAKEALAEKKIYKPDHYQGFNVDEDNQKPVGYITALKIGDKEYPANFHVPNPVDRKGPKLKVPAVLTALGWYGSSKYIALKAQVGPGNRRRASMQSGYMLTRELLNDPKIEFEFVIYEYDKETKKHYKSFHSGGKTLKGLIEKQGVQDLEFDIDSTPSDVVSSPRNYELYLSILPSTDAQEVHVAESPSALQVERWVSR
jgi:hypothetical protein